MKDIASRYARSRELWEKAKGLVLNGVQTLSKSPVHIAPEMSPIFIKKAKGAYFWDCDGNRYIDYPLSLGPVVLGHAYDEVDNAVKKQMSKGILYSLSSRLELELAELMCSVVPSAEKVKFLKTGSEAVSAAVRVARAYTGREMLAVCGYHGWHDWTVVRTARNAGVPASLNDLIHEFKYNDIDSLYTVFSVYPNKIAAVVLEPVGMYPPRNDFLKKIAAVAKKNGAVLIFDEIITGFRLALGGAQEYFSVTPDISAFGKAMGNGYSISALVGKKMIMDEVEDKIFISSTYGGDLLPITAALKTIRILKERNVNNYILLLGERLKEKLNKAIKINGIDAVCEGMPHKTFIIFNDMEGIPGKMIETVFRQGCFARGAFLGYGHFISYSHTADDIDQSAAIASEVLHDIRDALHQGNLPSLLKGEIATDVFTRY